MKTTTTLLLMFAMATLTAAAQEKPQAREDRHAARGAEPILLYRLEYSIHELEDGKRTNSRSYTLMTDGTRQNCALRIGSRVPIQTGGPNPPQIQYMDVGVNIDCGVREMGTGLTVESHLEVSGIPENPEREAGGLPVMRQYRFRAASLVTPGKPQVVAELDDVHSRRRMQVELTAARLK